MRRGYYSPRRGPKQIRKQGQSVSRTPRSMFDEHSPFLSVPPTLPHRSPLGSEGFHGERSTELPPVATLSESEPPSASPGNSPEPDEEDQLLLTSPRTTPPEHIPDTPTPRDTPCDVSQDLPSQDLFDATSPLTQLSTSCAEDQEIPQTPIGPPEDAIPMLCPHSDALLQKRKRASNRSKKSRRNKRLRCQAEQDPVEETHADPSIWPPAVEGDTNQKVSLVAFPRIKLLNALSTAVYLVR